MQKHTQKVTHGNWLEISLLQPEQGMVGMHLDLVQEHSLDLKSLKHC